MRDILFRGKTKGGKWVEGVYSPYNWDIRFKRVDKPQIIILSEDKAIDGMWCDVIPETVGQFTGLYDKNGVKIFEGDVVKYSGTTYEISYIEKYARFGGKNSCCIFSNVPFGLVKVIGNIHDNPELLKDGENNV